MDVLRLESAMTDVVVHLAGTAQRCGQFTVPLGRSFHRAMIAHGTRRALDELPDNLLKDIGLARSEIPFVAGTPAFEDMDPACDMPDRLGETVAKRVAAVRRLTHVVLCLLLVAVVAISAFVVSSRAVRAQDSQVKRGQYLVALAGCNDCHTPGYFFGKPDTARFLGGSEVGFEIPDRGVFYGPNLTPDEDTGLGKWSADDIVTAITAGQRPDGRILAPIMPWHAFANLTRRDARAIAAFLKSLPPVRNKVPGPFGPGEKPTSFVMKIVAPEGAAAGDSNSK
jgi:mono/diheme cytochrome c family protein/uncharacterized protein YjiS (DUF1127 family)